MTKKRILTISDTQCIEWLGSFDSHGYAQVYCNRRKKPTRAVRVLYERLHNVELASDQHLLHSCDNPKCIKLAHIRVGTHQDNMKDRRERNTFRGEKNPRAKLTDDQALEILRDKRSSYQTALDYPVTPSAIRLIRQGRRFSHLQEESV